MYVIALSPAGILFFGESESDGIYDAGSVVSIFFARIFASRVSFSTENCFSNFVKGLSSLAESLSDEFLPSVSESLELLELFELFELLELSKLLELSDPSIPLVSRLDALSLPLLENSPSLPFSDAQEARAKRIKTTTNKIDKNLFIFPPEQI
jgi:hypothetical protein